MNRKLSATFVIVTALLLCSIYSTLSARAAEHKTYSLPSLKTICATNSEAAFACKNKINLRQAEMADLLLIPGVGDKTAQLILVHRDEILAAASSGNTRAAFELVDGVGPKLAGELEEYLGVD